MLLQDILRLCEHVGAVGATQWDVLSAALRCPPALCALRWHALALEHARSKSTLKVPKYSDWELCVLMVVSLHGSLSKLQSEVHSYSCCSTVGGMLGMAVYSEQISSLDMQWLSPCVAPPPAAALSLRCASLELSTACCHVLVLTLWCTVRLLLQACDTGVAQNMSKASIYQGKSPLANSHTRTCPPALTAS